MWYCVTLELWFQARCKSMLFHSLVLYLVKFPSSRFCEIEEQNVCSWCWFRRIGSPGASLLSKYPRQKHKAPWLFSRGVLCAWHCVTLELWVQARCTSPLFHSLALYLDESNFHLPDSSRLKKTMNVLGAGF